MKILLVTAHFPAYDVPNSKGRTTPFLQHYAKEWVAMGHEVKLIHLMRSYPKAFYWFSNIAALLGNKQLDKYAVSREELKKNEYIYEGVTIQRIIYKKYVPHSSTSRGQIEKVKKELSPSIQAFKPDIVVGDCFDPVLQVITGIEADDSFPLLQIVHNSDFSLIGDKEIKKSLKRIDGWLLRSNAQRIMLNRMIDNRQYKYEYMYSGIESYRIEEGSMPRTTIERLLYVGALQKPKGIDTILDAMSISNNQKLTLKLVGSGIDEDYFKNRVKALNIEGRVHFEGAKPHDEVFHYMKESDALVLISHETFGMVYVEAMSQGCIPIGATNEGIDGVVVDGTNGFLRPLGDAHSLAELFDYFSSISPEKVRIISNNAYMKARKMTDNQLALNISSFFEQMISR